MKLAASPNFEVDERRMQDCERSVFTYIPEVDAWKKPRAKSLSRHRQRLKSNVFVTDNRHTTIKALGIDRVSQRSCVQKATRDRSAMCESQLGNKVLKANACEGKYMYTLPQAPVSAIWRPTRQKRWADASFPRR